MSSVTRHSHRKRVADHSCGGHPKSNRSMPTTKSRYHGSIALPMAPIQVRYPVRVFGIAPVEFPWVERAALARVARAAARTRLSRIRTTLVVRNFLRSPIRGL